MKTGGLPYYLVDVFATEDFGGNPLPVVLQAQRLTASQMLRIAQEFRQFETVFLAPTSNPGLWDVRVFDLVEELPFAGHPLLGAAGVLHALGIVASDGALDFQIGPRRLSLRMDAKGDQRIAWLDAGVPAYGEAWADDGGSVAHAFGLERADLDASLPLQVVDTGLRYLVVAVKGPALGRARIVGDVSELLHGRGADYAVLLDATMGEIRHWTNDGRLEDFATGSAASVVAAYLARHKRLAANTAARLSQGRYAGRPSELWVSVQGDPERGGRVSVGGAVRLIADGQLRALPK